MAEVEKYVPRRVITDISPGALYPGGDRMFLPGDMLDAQNARYKARNGSLGALESTPGTLLKNRSLPAGDNISLGGAWYEKRNRLVFAVWNSLGDHRVMEYDLSAGTFTTLLSGSSLNFSKDHYISHGGVIDGTWIFADGYNNARKLDIEKARNGEYYAPYSKAALSLAAMPPPLPPFTTFYTDSGLGFNNVSSESWQFAIRYVYFDNSHSPFSPLSKLIPAKLKPSFSSAVDNTIVVSFNFPAEYASANLVKRVEVAYRKGNTGDYFIFEEIKNPPAGFPAVYFTNRHVSKAVSKDDELRYSDALAPVPPALGIVESRVFAVLDKAGFDINTATFTFTTSLGNEVYVAGRRYLKDGGSYPVGILFSDEFGRSSFVKSNRIITVPRTAGQIKNSSSSGSSTAFGVNLNLRKVISWTLSGTPPPGMTRYQIVLGKNINQAQPVQMVVKLRFRTRENGPKGSGDDFYRYKGYKYCNPLATNAANNILNSSASLVLELPLNCPIVPERGDRIFFYTSELGITESAVISYENGMIVIEGNANTVWAAWDVVRDAGLTTQVQARSLVPMIEIYRPAVPAETFYEVGEAFPITGGAFSVLSGKVYGDQYIYNSEITSTPSTMSNIQHIYYFDAYPLGESDEDNEFPGDAPDTITPRTGNQGDRPSHYVVGESPSPTVLPGVGSGTQGSVFDYNKQDSDWGRVHIVNDDEKAISIDTEVGFSDPYIQNSSILGINIFRAANRYPLAVERSPIKALVSVKDNMIAIHERNTTSLYIGDSVIRQGNDFILAKSDDVVGDDRQMQFKFGTINPESVIEIDGEAFWWDALRGAVVQYTLAGLFPISNYGMKNYFYEKSREYFPYRATVKIITGYDFSTGELLITFPEVKDGFGETIISPVTWAFNIEAKEWNTRYSFVPELYCGLNTEAIAFKNGALWLLNRGTTHNNFFGVQYTRKIKLISNALLGKNKRYLNIHMKGDIAADMTVDTFSPAKFKTPEGQESHTPAYYFDKQEGKWVGPILKDVNTPDLPAEQLPLLSGDDIVSSYLEVELENDRTDKGRCTEINIIFKTEEFSI